MGQIHLLIDQLWNTINQLIQAGAKYAIGNNQLIQLELEFAVLAERIPLLQPLCSRIREVRTSNKNDSPHILLQLLAESRQWSVHIAVHKLFYASTEIVVELKQGPIGSEVENRSQKILAESLKSKMPIRTLIPILRQIGGSGSYRRKVRLGKTAVPPIDIRLIQQLLNWIENREEEFQKSLIEDILPRMGTAMIDLIEQPGFQINCSKDLQRLRLLALLDPSRAQKWVEHLDESMKNYLAKV